MDDPTADRHRLSTGRRLLVILLVVPLTLVVGAGAGVGVTLLADRSVSSAAPATVDAPAPQRPQPLLAEIGADGVAPTSEGVASSVAPLVDPALLGTVSARVVDPTSGGQVWESGSQTALVPGSTTKVVALAGALLVLDHGARFTTTVVQGAEPGTIVLVGGGDLTLNSLPRGQESFYPGAAYLDDLVDQVRATGTPVDRVLVDVSRYTGPLMAPGWLEIDIAAGYLAPMVPIMLDGGRADPRVNYSPRTATPGTDAGRELATRLGADPTSVEVGTAPAGAPVLASVQSPTMEQLVATSLTTSDNLLADALVRETARVAGEENSFAGAERAVRDALSEAGFDLGTDVLRDGSGMSLDNLISARLLTDVLGAAAAPDEGNPRTALLRPILEGLPVAGGAGTLANRYGADGAAGDARGWARAKTGTLTGVNSLAGIVLDTDGRVLVFAVLSNGPSGTVVRDRLDAVVAALRACGCR